MIEPKRLGEYIGWVVKNVPDPTGKCVEVTMAMVMTFPELNRVRGHFIEPSGKEWPHWWCVAEDGTIVDPTRAQFPEDWPDHYVPWVEGSQEPTGRCPNCGGYCYTGGTCCSEKCHNEYADFVMGKTPA